MERLRRAMREARSDESTSASDVGSAVADECAAVAAFFRVRSRGVAYVRSSTGARYLTKVPGLSAVMRRMQGSRRVVSTCRTGLADRERGSAMTINIVAKCHALARKLSAPDERGRS